MDFSGKHIYFLGIAGIGVSALAQVALARGAQVSGADPHADPHENPAVARLQAGGAALYREHLATNLADDVDLVVASAAVPVANPELCAAHERGLRIVTRAEFLGELMAAHRGPKIAVAGTHGKTTTTAMIGVMLQHAGLDPTVFVGGEVAQLGGNVRVGSQTGPFVAEACEAYDSFLCLQPEIAVITNVEADHLDHYGTFEHVLDSFVNFAGHVTQENGHLVVCADDAGTALIAERLAALLPLDRYGIGSGGPRDASVVSQATDIVYGRITAFRWHVGAEDTAMSVELHVPGKHNVYNALAAATVGLILAVPAEEIVAGLAEFGGATRRQEILGEIGTGAGSILVMDDYAHHPTEIRATLAALRGAYSERRLTAVFQPHLYSRTRDFLPEFAAALTTADRLIVTEVYAAREKPIPGVHASDIVALALRQRPDLPAVFISDQADIPTHLAQSPLPGDLTVFMGAGDIREQGEEFVRQLIEQERP